MRHIIKYKLFESKEGTSRAEICDILADLIDEEFDVMITSSKPGQNRFNMDIITNSPIDTEDTFHVSIMTDYLYKHINDDNDDEFIDNNKCLFRWKDVESPVKQLISYMSTKYVFYKCVIRIIQSDVYDVSDINNRSLDYTLNIDEMTAELELFTRGSHDTIKLESDRDYITEVIVEFGPITKKEYSYP